MISEGKIFVISWGGTESRYDPNYHRGIGYSLSGWEKLGRVATVKGGKRIPLGDTYAHEKTGYYYLRVDNLSDNGNLTGDMKWLNESTFKALERYRIFSGDLLISIAGTIGRISVFDEGKIYGPTILTENCAKIHLSDDVLPEYMMLLLLSEPLQKQMERDYIQTTIPKLGLDRIRGLRLPEIPSLKVQKSIVSLWNLEFDKYTSALKSAAALLESIDEYLLSELRITLPPEPENTIANRILTAHRKELAGWRFDARVHQYDFNLQSARHPNVPLKQLAHINPRTVFSGVKGETPLTFVPMESISDEDGTIASPQQRNFSENVGYTSFQEGDLLWAKITPCMENGKSAVAQNLLNGFGFGSTEYHVLRPKSGDLYVHYLHAILRIKRLRKAAENYFGGSSGHQRVDEAFFYRLSIPVPSPEVQGQLAKRIESMRQEAQQLRSNALAELNAAKSRIEAMLLGEVTV